MYVFPIEGPHGAGKTTLLRELKEQGYPVLEENFLTLDIGRFPLGSQYHRYLWLLQWFRKIHDLYIRNPGPAILFTDRSFLTTFVYSVPGNEQRDADLINMLFSEFCENFDIHFIPIILFPPLEENYKRITKRFEEDSKAEERLVLQEADKQYLENIRTRYLCVLDKYVTEQLAPRFHHIPEACCVRLDDHYDLSPSDLAKKTINKVGQRYPDLLNCVQHTTLHLFKHSPQPLPLIRIGPLGSKKQDTPVLHDH